MGKRIVEMVMGVVVILVVLAYGIVGMFAIAALEPDAMGGKAPACHQDADSGRGEVCVKGRYMGVARAIATPEECSKQCAPERGNVVNGRCICEAGPRACGGGR